MDSERARPFYTAFAWAYDLLVDRPVEAECDHVALALAARGVPPGARVLDAGCGTGRYAAPLARRGYRVTGVDRSADLLAVARARLDGPAVAYARADLLALPVRRAFGGLLCRGVLNDLLDDDSRGAALAAFAGAPGA